MHSKAGTFSSKKPVFESLARVIREKGHLKPPLKKMLLLQNPIEATPLSFGIDKFLQIFPSHFRAAPAASEIKHMEFVGWFIGGLGIGKLF